MANQDDRTKDDLTQRLDKCVTPPDAMHTSDWRAADSPPDRPNPSVSGLFEIPGYQIVRSLDSGGMGAIYEAVDLRFNRRVAIKMMGAGMSKQRFLNESMITARLPHPAVPPVYAIGEVDGRRFLAMKLIRGGTLTTLLQKKRKTGDEKQPLSILRQVAEGVGFAHSEGIIHRDLKPDNIMVGSFGEVHVVDWGLAKQLGGTEREPGPIADPWLPTSQQGSTGGNEMALTFQGDIMGTPSYLSPEQARGDEVDARTDVYSLGCILCDILTGRPPIFGGAAIEIVRRAQEGDLAEAFMRLDQSTADPELIAIAKACLQPKAADRLPDGRAVAERLAAYQDNFEARLRESEKARDAQEIRMAESAKRRRVWMALAGLALFALATIAYFLRQQELAGIDRKIELGRIESERSQERELVKARALALANADANVASDSLQRGKLDVAEVTARQIEDRFPDGMPGELAEKVATLRTDLEMVRELNRIRDRSWTVVNFNYESEKARREYPLALAKYGLPVGEQSKELLGAKVESSTIVTRLVFALDDWLQVAADADKPPILELLLHLDADSRRNAIRSALHGANRGDVMPLLNDLDAAKEPPAFVATLAFRSEIPVEKRRALLERAWNRIPSDYLLTLSLAVSYGRDEPRDWPRSAEFSRSVLALDPKSAVAWNNLGNALRELRRLDDALPAFEKSVALEPNVPSHHNGLGAILRDRGETARAAEAYQKAVELQPDDAGHRNGLGILLAALGRRGEAMAEYRKAVELAPTWDNPVSNWASIIATDEEWRTFDQSLVDVFSQQPNEVRAPLCQAHSALYSRHKRFDLAMPWMKRFTELATNQIDPWRGVVSLARAMRDYDVAIEACRKQIEIAPELPKPHYDLAFLHIESGKRDEGLDLLDKAVDRLRNEPQLALNAASLLHDAGRVDEAYRMVESTEGKGILTLALVDKLARSLCERNMVVEADRLLKRADAQSAEFAKNETFAFRATAVGIRLGFSDSLLSEDERLLARDRAEAMCHAIVAKAHWILRKRLATQYREAETLLRNMLTDPDFAASRNSESLSHLSDNEKQRWQVLWRQANETRDELASLAKDSP